jgi:hypothetical protein
MPQQVGHARIENNYFHGPEHLDVFGRIIVFALGIVFGIMSFARGTNAESVLKDGLRTKKPLNKPKRVILFLIALVLLLLALGVLK